MAIPTIERGPLSSTDARPSAYAWTVVGLLFVVALLNYLDRLMITTMRDPIRADIHITDAQFGLFTSVFLWSYAACSPLGGYVADRFGRRRVILASLLFWSVATILSGIAHSAGQMMAARVLMGVSEACYIPAALSMISDYHRGPTRSLATGLHMIGLYAGAALGGTGGYLADAFGWRFGFHLFGVVGIAYFIVLFFSLREAPIAARWEAEEAVTDSPTFAVVARALLATPAVWFMLAVNVLVGIVNWTVNAWLPTFLKDRFRLGNGAAGLSATAYIQVASFAAVIAAGVIADRWSRRNPRARAFVPAIGWLLASPCLFLAASTPLLPLAIVGLIVFGIGRGAFDANQMPIVRQIVDERYSATCYGFLNFIGTAVGGAMVYAGGQLKDANVDLTRVFQSCGVCLAGAGLLLAAIRLSRRTSESDSRLTVAPLDATETARATRPINS